MARNSTERLGGEYDLESSESAFFLHNSQQQKPTQPFLAFTNKAVLCLF